MTTTHHFSAPSGSHNQEFNSDRIQDALYSFIRSQLLFTAIDLNLFTLIAQGHYTVEPLAELLEVDPRALRIFMDGLVGIQFLRKDDEDHYLLPADVAWFLVQEKPDYMGGMVKHCKRLYENWALLTDVVRTGQPAGGAQSLADIEIFFSELVRGLYVSNYPIAKKLARMLQIGTEAKGLHILDVAGGSAVWSIALVEADPKSRATVLDYPSVISVAQEFVQTHELTAQYDFLPADLEVNDIPPQTFDLAILGNICHAIGASATQTLLKKLGQSLKPNGEVVIIDFVPDDKRSQPGWPLVFGVNMLVSTPDGDVFTEAQYRDWLHHVGFHQVKRDELEPGVTVLIAKR